MGTMSIKKLLEEIQTMIDRTPYTKEEIASIWKAESERDWEPETIFALAAAYEYLHRMDNPEAQFLRGKYEKLLSELKERYASNSPTPNR